VSEGKRDASAEEVVIEEAPGDEAPSDEASSVAGDEGPRDEASTSDQGPGGRSAAPSRGAIAVTVGVIGELLITAGLVLALFVVYSLWWTNVLADRQAKKEGDRVRDHWAADRGPGNLDTRDGIGFLHAPSMLSKDILVKKGTNPKELNQGIAGYYTKPVKSALPQDRSGNFALAAHRDGHGAKFHNIDKIDKGDPIVFETKDTWYVYKVFKTLPQTSKYNVDVLDAVPKGSGKKERGRYITLTTCTPVYTSKYRYIVWGELVRTEDVDEDRTPPAELK
jgi:LPXTG-site transpeptidase (sortase) family protein